MQMNKPSNLPHPVSHQGEAQGEAARTSTPPPPAYSPFENIGLDFGFDETTNIRPFDNAAPHQPEAESNIQTYSQLVFSYDNQTTPNTESKPSLFDRMLRIKTPLHDSYDEIDTRLGNWGLLFQVVHYVAAIILLSVAGVSIKLYENPWNQSETVGGATLSYGLAGSIVGCIAGTFCICFGSIGYLVPAWGLILQCLLFIMYWISGGLTGYGTYVTRNNHICNNQHNGNTLNDCYDIRLSPGWRCGFVVVAMCGIIVIEQLVFSTMWLVTWLKISRLRSRS